MLFKKILNLHEEATHYKLRKVCDKYSSKVYPKVRLADVLPIEGSGISKKEFRFALQSHFDFIVTDSDHNPLFAVELDSRFHDSDDQKIRDERKDRLCKIFNLPILRINTGDLSKKYRNFDLLSWFIEVWFFREAYFQAQMAGKIPWDETFDPMSILKLEDQDELFPLWLSLDVRAKIGQLSEQKRCLDPYPTEWIGIDERGNYHGIAWLWVDKKYCVYSCISMRSQHFPIEQSDLLSELLVFHLYEELLSVVKGKARPKLIEKINQLVESYINKYELGRAGGLRLPNSNSFHNT